VRCRCGVRRAGERGERRREHARIWRERRDWPGNAAGCKGGGRTAPRAPRVDGLVKCFCCCRHEVDGISPADCLFQHAADHFIILVTLSVIIYTEIRSILKDNRRQ